MNNKLMIAAAGAGKTYTLIEEALQTEESTLITTFTTENAENIRKSFLDKIGYIPQNVTVQTWFSFLLQHGVKPFLGSAMKDKNFKVKGLFLVNSQSARYEKAINNDGFFNKNHYFSREDNIYSDKISKFVYVNNNNTNNVIIRRMNKIFKNIFIDETQDLAGYDLELIKLLLESDSNTIMVGDARQVTYHTHFSQKNKKYKDGNLELYLQEKCNKSIYIIDKETLKDSHRCCQEICDFANTIFPDEPKSNSKREDEVRFQGIFFVKTEDVDKFLIEYNPMQLRHDRRRKVNLNFLVKNFGQSKGDTVDNVLIYPTAPIKNWIISGTEMTFETKSKFYVAVTRAKYGVGIVWDDKIIPEQGKLYVPTCPP